MGKRRQSETAMLERRRRERLPGGGRMISMRIDVVFGDDNNTILSAGGLWDRRAKTYEGEATESVVVEPHAGEIPAILWFLAWARVHAGRRDHPPPLDEAAMERLDNHEVDPTEVFSALFAGGRRGGKTWTAALLCVIYAIAFPGSIVWVVNPSDEKHEECRRYFGRLLAPEWIDHHTESDGWWLANGSEIMLKSGYTGADPDAIKEGEAHLIWLNEAQKMKPRVYIVARAAISDRSGLVLCCANPPVESKDQPWVGDLAADAQANRRMAHFIHFDPRDNPHINRTALLSMRFELDERAYRIEILGEFLPSIDKVAYNWLRTRGGNEQSRPEDDDPVWVDVTEEFCALVELGDRITDIIGLDFQIHPHLGGPVLRVYAPRNEVPTRNNVVLWGVDEVIVQGDELEWCAEAHHKRYDPETTQLIGDGTGEYQSTRRRKIDSLPPHLEGKGSFEMLKMGGYWRVTRPDPAIPKNNPHVIDRVRAMTSMIESYARVRRLFLDPDRCPKTAKSVREWPTVHGKPSRIHEAAHLGDALSYPIVRIFPRKLRSETTGAVDPVIERLDLLPTPKGFGPPPRPTTSRSRDRSL